MTKKPDRMEASQERTEEEIDKILQRALKEPGVKEVMELHRKFEELSRAARPYQRALEPKFIISSSDCSGYPTSR